MEIYQIDARNQLKNFNYLLKTKSDDIYCIDPWDADQLIAATGQIGGRLVAIINTHEHHDHIRGNSGLVEYFGCEVWVHENAKSKIPGSTRGLKAQEKISLSDDGDELEILDTPGHTMAHLCLLAWKEYKPWALFSGDTLFNAGVGNCHNGGDPETLYETITNLIAPLDDEVRVYPGHDYLENNLRFTLDREPDNSFAKDLLEQLKVSTSSQAYLTTMGLEKKMNTFFRLNSEQIKARLKLPPESTAREVFLALRAKRNHW